MPEEKDEIAVDTSVQRHYSAENVNRAQQILGCVTISGEQLKALQEIGVETRHLGFLEVSRGSTMFTQGAILQAMTYLSKVITNSSRNISHERKERAAKTIGYLTDKLARLNSTTLKSDQSVVNSAIEAEKIRRQSFGPGMRVNGSITVAEVQQNKVEKIDKVG